MILNKLTLTYTSEEESIAYLKYHFEYHQIFMKWLFGMQVILELAYIIYFYAIVKVGYFFTYELIITIAIPTIELTLYLAWVRKNTNWNIYFIQIQILLLIFYLTELLAIFSYIKDNFSLDYIQRFGYIFGGVGIGLTFSYFFISKIGFHIHFGFGLLGCIYFFLRLTYTISESKPALGIIFTICIWIADYLLHRIQKLDFHEKFIQTKSLEQFKEILYNIFPSPIIILKRSIYQNNKIEVDLKFQNKKFISLWEQFGKYRVQSIQDLESINKSVDQSNERKEAPQLNVDCRLIDNSEKKEKSKSSNDQIQHLLEYLHIEKINNLDECSIKIREEEEFKFIHYKLICTPIQWLGEKAEILIFEDITSLKELNDVKNKLIGLISSNLIAPFISSISLLEEAKSLNNLQEMQNIINSALQISQGIQYILHDMKDLSEIFQNKLLLKVSEISIFDSINVVENALRPLIKSKRTNFQIKTNMHEQTRIKTDKMRLQQILYNLAKNAISSTNEGQVVLVVDQNQLNNEEQLNLQIRDNGTGIKEESLPRLFTLFGEISRAEKNELRDWDYIGQYVSNKLAKLLNPNPSSNGIRVILIYSQSYYQVESELDVGSKFEFFLPMNIDIYPQLKSAEVNQENVKWSSLYQKSFSFHKRCLLVENDKEQIECISGQLEAEKFEYLHAWSVDEALKIVCNELMSSKSFDFILIEKQLAYLEQNIACRELNSIYRKYKKPRIPIVLLCNEIIDPNIEWGVVICLKKPINQTDIRLVISNIETMYFKANK